MKKAYAVYYTLTSANGFPIIHHVVVKTLAEVNDAQRRIKEAGYEFNGFETI